MDPPRQNRREKRTIREINASLPTVFPPKRSRVIGIREEVEADENVVAEVDHIPGGEDSEQSQRSGEEEGARTGEHLMLSSYQKLVYTGNFVLHFGFSKRMLKCMEDWHVVVSRNGCAEYSYGKLMAFFDELFAKYDHSVSYFCNSCDGFLTRDGICSRVACRRRNVAPKRSKKGRRTSVHVVNVTPQLELILSSVIDRLLEVHRRIHAERVEGRRRSSYRGNTSDFVLYRNDIESSEQFSKNELHLVLTLGYDGVRLKKLSRCQAYPLYLRLEGLPQHYKNLAENIILGGVIFTRHHSPSERILRHFFCRLRIELAALNREGLTVSDSDGSMWKVFPRIRNSIIDFYGMRELFNSPRWLSSYGCHYCCYPGERSGGRLHWCIDEPFIHLRRSRATILRDADAHANGLQGTTEMMHFLTMERCRGDALHLMSEGITTDLMQQIFQSKTKAREMSVSRAHLAELDEALESVRNFSYAPKFVLGMGDWSCMTGSEKEAIASIAFPLVSANLLCHDAVGSVAVLSYWIVVRLLEKPGTFSVNTLRAVRDLAILMKSLWAKLAVSLFTLKLHVLLDHCLIEDLEYVGSPTQWSSAPFESMHRRLQLRVNQCTTNSEETVLRSFLLKKHLFKMLEVETEKCGDERLAKLRAKISNDSRRFPSSVELNSSWRIPLFSEIDWSVLKSDHYAHLSRFLGFRLSSRISTRTAVYSSAHYWKRAADSIQHCVCLEENGRTCFGNIVAFAYNQDTAECKVLIEQFLLGDPFRDLHYALLEGNHCATGAAHEALQNIRTANVFFKKILLKSLEWQNEMESNTNADHNDDVYEPNYTTLGAGIEEPSNSHWYLENSQGSSGVEAPSSRSSGRRRTSPHSVTSMTTTQSDIPEGAIHNNRVDFEKLGQLVANVESGPEYEESVIKKLRGCRIDMERVRAHTHAVSSIPTSSDSPVVRSLCETVRQQTDIIVGMAATIDSLISLGLAQDAALRKTNSYVLTASKGTLPGDRRFSVENLTRAWVMQAKPPFKETNFGDLLVRWQRPTRPGPTDHYALILDFCRRYFQHACDPEREIQRFACRLTGKAGKDPGLTDLPEDIVSFVSDFLIDALGLGDPDIDMHERGLVARRSLFWTTLGSNDEERSNLLRQLKLAKVEWISLARKAIGRALTDLRSYNVTQDATLVPSNKRKRPALHSTENIPSE